MIGAQRRLTRCSSSPRSGPRLLPGTHASVDARVSTSEGVATELARDPARRVNEAVRGTHADDTIGRTPVICRGTQWFSPDGSGSIAAVTGGNTALRIAQNCYGVFGQVMTTNPNSGDPLQYLGGMNDMAVAVDYLGGKGAWSSNLGQDLSGFTGGVLNCVGHAAVGLVSGIAHQLANPLSPITGAIGAVNSAVQAVRQKGLALAVLDPITDTLQQLGDFSSPEAAGNSLCNDTLAGLVVVGGVDTLVEGPCFPAGTPITTPKGVKPIEKVRVGDVVLSADPKTGRRSYQKVTRTFVHPSSILLKIETADGRMVEATPTHPFWVKGKGFVAAKRLARSDLLEDDHGRFGAVVKVTARRGRFTVYNFEVARTHTYFAGGFWVHNTCVPSNNDLAGAAEDAFRYDIEHNVGADLLPKPPGGVYGGGPDAVWAGTGNDPGWDWAELKPNTDSGKAAGIAQIKGRYISGDWTGRAALYLYDLNMETGGFDFTLWASFED